VDLISDGRSLLQGKGKTSGMWGGLLLEKRLRKDGKQKSTVPRIGFLGKIGVV